MQERIVHKRLTVFIFLLCIGILIVPNISSNQCSVKEITDDKVLLINQPEKYTVGMDIFLPTDDTQIRMMDPDINYGQMGDMGVRNRYGFVTDDWEHDSLIRFDISSIPLQDVYVTDAKLHLYYSSFDGIPPAGRNLTLLK